MELKAFLELGLCYTYQTDVPVMPVTSDMSDGFYN